MDSSVMKNLGQWTPGEKFVYHVGDLASDRVGNPHLNQTAETMLDLYQRNEVELVQRRLGFGEYEYIAVRKKKTGLVQRFFTGCYAEQ